MASKGSFVNSKIFVGISSLLALACVSDEVVNEVGKHLPQSITAPFVNFKFRPYETALTETYMPIALCVGYLVSVYVLKALMKNSKPFDLYWIRIVHNFVLSFGSLVMLLGMVKETFLIYQKNGLDSIVCDVDRKQMETKQYFWLYVFYLSKFYEFIDTYILILRKKPLIFLHVFHHFITAILAWSALVTGSAIQWMVTSLNATVHVFMYYYYLAQTVGEDMWWKKYLTTSQIIQFVIDLVGISVWWYYSLVLNQKCSGEVWAMLFTYFVLGSFLILFINFYIQTFKKKGKGGKKEE